MVKDPSKSVDVPLEVPSINIVAPINSSFVSLSIMTPEILPCWAFRSVINDVREKRERIVITRFKIVLFLGILGTI